MAKLIRPKFGTTGVFHDSRVEQAAYMEADAKAEIGKTIAAAGKQMQHQQDQVSIARANNEIRNQNIIIGTEFENDAEGYNKAFGIMQTNVLSTVPQHLQDRIGANAFETSELWNAKYKANEIKRQDELDDAAIAENQTNLHETMSNAALAGDNSLATLNRDEFLDHWKSQIGLTITAAQYLKIREQTDSVFDRRFIQGTIDRMVQAGDLEGLTTYLEGAASTTAAMLSPLGDGTRKLAPGDKDYARTYASTQLNNLAKAQAASTSNDNTQMNTVVRNLEANVATGQTIDEATIEKLRTSGSENAAIFLSNYDTLNTTVQGNGKTFREMSLTEQAHFIGLLNKNDSTAANKKLLAMAEGIHKAYQSGELAVGEASGWFEDTPIEWGTENAVEQVKQKGLNCAIMAQHMGSGFKCNPFNADELNLMQAQIEEGGIAVIQSLAEGLGSDSFEVFQAIAPNNPVVAMAGSLYVDGKHQIAESLLYMDKAIKANPANYITQKTYNKILVESGNDEISSRYGQNYLQQKVAKDAVYARYIWLMTNGGRSSMEEQDDVDTSVYEQAIKDVLPVAVEVNDGGWFGSAIRMDAPDSSWNEDNAQDKYDEWIDSLTDKDFEGIPDWVLKNLKEGDEGFYLSQYADGSYGIINDNDGLFVTVDGKVPTVRYTKEEDRPVVTIDESNVTKVVKADASDVADIIPDELLNDTETVAADLTAADAKPNRIDYPNDRKGRKQFKLDLAVWNENNK